MNPRIRFSKGGKPDSSVKVLVGLLLLPSDMIISVTRQLFIFAEKQKDKLFWDGNVGHVQISHKPAKTRYVGIRVIMKQSNAG